MTVAGMSRGDDRSFACSARSGGSVATDCQCKVDTGAIAFPGTRIGPVPITTTTFVDEFGSDVEFVVGSDGDASAAIVVVTCAGADVRARLVEAIIEAIVDVYRRQDPAVQINADLRYTVEGRRRRRRLSSLISLRSLLALNRFVAAACIRHAISKICSESR